MSETTVSAQKNQGYPLPFFKTGSGGIRIQVVICFLILGWLILKRVSPSNAIVYRGLGMMMAIYLVMLGYYWVALIQKKNYVRLTDEYIEYSTPFKKVLVGWKEIEGFYVSEGNNAKKFNFVLNSPAKRSMVQKLLKLPPTLSVSLNQFKDIDSEQFYATIKSKVFTNFPADSSVQMSLQDLGVSKGKLSPSVLRSMKEYGAYYYRQDGNSFSIYLVNPKVYDQAKAGQMLVVLQEGCYVERAGKDLKALYLPEKTLNKFELTIGGQRAEINGEHYLLIDLGSTGGYEPYIYNCSLIYNSEKEVELIELTV